MSDELSPAKGRLTDGLGYTDPARDVFERHVLQWTGRDVAYHHRNGTTGLEFAWHCWQAGSAYAVAAERERCASIAESWATEETATTCANVAAAIRWA